LSRSRADSPAAAQKCEDLLAAARSACADQPPSTCDGSDDCIALLAKRKARLACDRAWLELKDGAGCARGISDEQEAMDRNKEVVEDCGRRISRNPECCPENLNDQRKDCKKRMGSCLEEREATTSLRRSTPAPWQASARAFAANSTATKTAKRSRAP
jgi:hypothetical protein